MNVATMNPATGGPVGGGMMMMMNNGHPPPATSSSSSHSDLKRRLDTYIYDYFLKNGHHEHARALLQDDSIKLNTHPQTKSSPSRRRDGEMNGIDSDAMDTDSKDDVNKIPDDLPKPDVPDNNTQSLGFLYDWFGLFFDIYGASRNKKPDDTSTAAQYLQQTQLMQRMRETQHSSNVLGRQGMMPNRQFGPQNMRNGMNQEMQRAIAANKMTPQQMVHLQQQKHHQMMQQMQREQSENEMNGHRPQSPASTENAGSPSKRPRLEGQQFAGGPMAPNGRGQGGPQQAQAMNMLMANGMANGMNGRNLSQSQFQAFQGQNPAMQQKNLQVYAQNLAAQQGRSMINQASMPNGMMNPGVMPNQGSPILGPVDGQNFMQGMQMDPMYSNQQMAVLQRQANMQGGNGQGGNHALQDYQMQLMLLEQQNKKRLMMARQEQDSISRTDPMPGQPGMQPPGLSPGSRTGASPNPSDQIKRGTPQLNPNGMPSSPSAGDAIPQARGSPAGMNFAGGMPQDFNNQLFMKNIGEGMVGQGGPGMRPPTSMNPNMNPNMNLEAIARQQGGRLPGGNWQGNSQGQPMMQQPPQAQPQAMGTPQQRAVEMPPPSARAATNGTAPRNQPPSPQPGQAPPTPLQSNKANPKSKKDKNEPKKRSNKKNSTTNAPNASEADPPATPTPSTPITPVNQASFAKGPNAPANGHAPTSNPTPTSNPPAPQQQAPAVDPTAGAGAFGDFNPGPESFNLDFSGLETGDVLENFDFDSFLHNTDDNANGFSFDPGMNFSEGLETSGME